MKEVKKIVLVVLILFCVSLSILSKEEYEGWDKWDEELPPADSEKWHWASVHQAVEHNFHFTGHDDINVLVTTGSFYYGAKPFKEKVSVLFYSSEDIDNWTISDSIFAIAAFPSKKNEILVRAYQKIQKENLNVLKIGQSKLKPKKKKILFP